MKISSLRSREEEEEGEGEKRYLSRIHLCAFLIEDASGVARYQLSVVPVSRIHPFFLFFSKPAEYKRKRLYKMAIKSDRWASDDERGEEEEEEEVCPS